MKKNIIHILVIDIIIIIVNLVIFNPFTKLPTAVDCNYKLPPQYYLVKDSVSGKYAILFMHLDTYPYYLYVDEPFYSNMGSLEEAKLFIDSCEAKRFCKTFLFDEYKRTHSRDFKIIK